VSPEAFQVELNTGEWVTPLTASLIPNGEYNERQTVVLSGYWGNRLPPDDPDALHPVRVSISETGDPLVFVTPQGLVSAAGLEIDSGNPYVEGNGPRIVAANLDVYSDLGEGSTFWMIASNGNSGSDLYGDEAQFRLRIYTSAGFSPDGIGSILPTDFGRYFRLEALDESGVAVWMDEAGVDYTIAGHGSVRVVGLADTVRDGNHPALFDPVFYLRSNPDVRDAFGADHDLAWSHYLQYGAGEAHALGGGQRAPAPWFDINHYLDTNPDLVEADITPELAFLHFVNHGMMEFRAPNVPAVADPATPGSLLDYALASPDLMEAFGVAAGATELSP